MKFLIAFFGWLTWTIIILRIDKDEYDDHDKAFPIVQYFLKNWDNWLMSLCGVFIIGTFNIEEGLLSIANQYWNLSLTWTDAYYLAAGVIVEIPYYIIKKWKKQKSTE